MLILTKRKTKMLVEALGRKCFDEVCSAGYENQTKKLNEFVEEILPIVGKKIALAVIHAYEAHVVKYMEGTK